LLLDEIGALLGRPLHPHSRIVPQGRVGGAVALLNARGMLAEGGGHNRLVVAGVDSYLIGATLAAYDAADRLLTPANSNGFIPGEAAAAVLLGPYQEGLETPLLLRGLGFAREPAPLGSGRPLRAEGLVQAVRGALGEAGIGLEACDHRIADVSGEQYRFKEVALAVTRLLRERKVWFGLWHTADCIGEIGAAALPAMLAVLFTGARKDYLPGPVFLGHLANDDERRAAFVAQATLAQSLALEAEAWARFGPKRRGEAA
jgi:3-oxoacyl-[acyl-carrier-protein] synthase-1